MLSITDPSGHHRVERYWRHIGNDEPRDTWGYFLEPETKKTTPHEGKTVMLSQLHDLSCLVLLGEPGLGKTTELDEAEAREREQNPFHIHHRVNLNRFNDTYGLTRAIFEHPKWREWQEGEGTLHLWLDSLDECLLRLNAVASFLGEELRECDAARSRLILRIACRSAVWPTTLQQNLQAIFGKEKVHLLHLCSLSRRNVEVWAESVDVESGAFLNAVEYHGAAPMASNPVTLKFLLAAFKNGRMPATRADLFRDGCLYLCSEWSQSRLDARQVGHLTPPRRLEIASRIAALAALCGKPFVWRSSNIEAPSVALTMADILGESEGEPSPDGLHSNDVNEVLDTSLFSGLSLDGVPVLTFGHQTYTEFLAAHHLLRVQMPDDQLISLLSHGDLAPSQSNTPLVPQLSEIAAWASNENRALFSHVMRVQPDLLVQRDMTSADDSDKARLVTSLLEEVEAGRLVDSWNLRHVYKRLNYPGLAAQLQPIIADGSKDIITRRMAIDIAESCPQAYSLVAFLADVALDVNENINIRNQAAHAVQTAGDEAMRLRFKPLALEPQPEDRDDELKGAALLSLWPTLISAEEVFASLTPPKSDLFGAYQLAIHRLAEKLQPADLPVALRWCVQLDERMGFSDELWDFRHLVGDILNLACRHLNHLEVCRLFAEAIAVRMRQYDLETVWPTRNDETDSTLLSDDERRDVSFHLVVLLAEHDSLHSLVFDHGSRFAWVLPQDLPWLLEQLKSEADPDKQSAWAQLIEILFSYYGLYARTEAMEAVVPATQSHFVLAEQMRHWFGPIELNSEQAVQMRSNWESRLNFDREQQERERQARTRETEEKAARRRVVEQRLMDSENGDFEAYWMFDLAMMSAEQSMRGELGTHVTQSSFWRSADEAWHGRVLATAIAYLRGREPQSELWLRSSTFHRPATAGHRALLLLFLEDRGALDALPDEVLSRWAPVTVWFPWHGDETGERDNQSLLAYLHDRVPQAVADAVEARIDDENARDENYLFTLRKLAFPWSETLHQMLITKARQADLHHVALYNLLHELLERETLPVFAQALSNASASQPVMMPGPARVLGEELLRATLSAAQAATSDEERQSEQERARSIALALLDGAIDGGWPIVWPAMQVDPEWGRELMLDFARHTDLSGRGIFLQWLPAEQVKDWFLWLLEQFPLQEDPHPRGAHMVSPREDLSHLRDGLLRILQQRGTLEALQFLERIKLAVPDHWVRHVLPQARRITLAQTWQPLKPIEVLKVLYPQKYNGATMQKVKILFIAANPVDPVNPDDTVHLSHDEEQRLIQERITSATHRDLIEVISVVAARPNDVLQAFNRHTPQVVHFTGHGNDKELLLCDADGYAQPVRHEILTELFRIMPTGVQVAVFSACLSRPQAEAVKEHIPCAIGMSDTIDDYAATVFAGAFYQAIAFGQSVKSAFDQGVWAMKAEGCGDHDIPQIFVKDGVDASQVVPVKS